MSDHELIRRPHQPYMSLPELSGSLTRKRKGEISFETPPSACPILEDPIRPPDHSIVVPELIGKGPVDINTASAQELEKLPGVAASEAQAIIAGRPYDNTSQLVKRHILSKVQYNNIRAQIGVK